FKILFGIPLCLIYITGCSGPSASEKDNGDQDPSAMGLSSSAENVVSLSEKERSEGWEYLFDGQNLEKWRSEKSNNFPSDAWVIEDGALVMANKGGNIITREKYGDFELVWEFKLSPEANSGIKYFVDSITNKGT